MRLRDHFYVQLMGGMLVQAVGSMPLLIAVQNRTMPVDPLVAFAPFVVGSALLVWGAWYYVTDGGVNGWWALFGLLNLLGLALLLIMFSDSGTRRPQGFEVQLTRPVLPLADDETAGGPA